MSATEESHLRILFVHENYGPTGGAETNIQITAEELKAKGHRLALLYNSPRKTSAWIREFPERYEAMHLPSSISWLQSFQPDIIYAHKLLNLDLFEAVLNYGKPAVRRVHDHEMYCLREYKYNPLTRKVCHRSTSGYCIFPCLGSIARNRSGGFPIRFASFKDRLREMDLSRRCELFMVYSEYSKLELVRNGFDPAKIHIHVPIRCWGDVGPVSSFSPRNVILFAGQIIRGKGVDLLVKALSKLTVPFEAILVGDGSHRARCEKLSSRLGLADRVKFAGYVPHAQMRDFYLEATVFAMSSVWPEPFGLSGPEAMRYGLPVVAFDAGGIGEWLVDGHNGFLTPWMDVDTFSARLQQLLINKPLAREMGRRGMQEINAVYDSRRQVGQLESLFFQLSNGGRTAHERRRSPTPVTSGAAQLLDVGDRQSDEQKHAIDAMPVDTL